MIVLGGLPAAGKSYLRTRAALECGTAQVDCALLMRDVLSRTDCWTALRGHLARMARQPADILWPRPGIEKLQIRWTPTIYAAFEELALPWIEQVIRMRVTQDGPELLVEATPIFAVRLIRAFGGRLLMVEPLESVREDRLRRRCKLDAVTAGQLAAFQRQIYQPAMARLPDTVQWLSSPEGVCIRF